MSDRRKGSYASISRAVSNQPPSVIPERKLVSAMPRAAAALALLGLLWTPASGLPPTVPQPPAAKTSASLPTTPQGPQAFELLLGDQTSFGFAASKPGPIVVTVTWQGAPLVVTLVKPGGGTLERQGSGSVVIQYTASAEDFRKGVLWSVNLRSPQAAAAVGSPVHEKPVKQQPQVLARGTVTLHHPPGDPKLAQAEVTARLEKLKASQPKPQPVPATQSPSLLAQKQAALLKQQAVRQTQLLDQVRSKIPAEAHQKMAQKISAAASVPLPGAKVVGTALPVAPQVRPANVPPQPSNPAAKATKEAPPAGTTDPVIAALSISAGQPGDPVLITGSGFSNTTGEVHFIVANGRDVTAPISGWNDSQIFAAVPDVSGILGFSGQVYVRRGSTNSRFVPFQFNPAQEVRALAITNDRIITGGTESGMEYRSGAIEAFHLGWGDLFGARNEDQYFLMARLRNGWVVDSAYITNVSSGYERPGPYFLGNASAYITECRIGTDSPYLKVRWWRDGLSIVVYTPNLLIRGPKGVPHQ